jgi:hypothetical protein
MPSEFNKLGIRFLYPDNWALSEDTAPADCRSVSVVSPGGAFWTVAIHPRATDPAGLVKAAVEAMRAEYTDLEVEEVCETIAGHELVGCDLNFYYLDLTNTTVVRSLRGDNATYTVFYQAEDREMARIREVLQAVTTSLLENVRRTADPERSVDG